jgi:hypothetical protein
MPGARSLLLCTAPAALAGLCWALAWPMPQDSIAGQILQSGLLSAIAPLMAAGALLSLVSALTRGPLWIWGPALLSYLLVLGPPPLGEAPEGGFVLVSANLDAFSEGPPGAAQALAALGADVVITIERRVEEIEGLRRVADNHRVPMRRPSHGTAIFCRPGLSCEAAISPEFGSESFTMPLGLLRVPVPRASGGSLPACVLGLHAPPPAPLDPSGLLPYVGRVAEAVVDGRMARQWGPCLAGDPVLAMGDFNHVPGTPANRLLLAAGLRHGERGRAPWRASWPAGGGWPNLPVFELDQAMAGPDLQIRSVRRSRIPGADHKALRIVMEVR